MPIFEFRCRACGHDFEKILFSSDTPEDIVCPRCGGKETEKLVSQTARSGGKGGCSSSCTASSCST